MDDIEKRAHDLALLYIKLEVESGKLELPKVDELRDFVGHYDAQYENFLGELKFFRRP